MSNHPAHCPIWGTDAEEQTIDGDRKLYVSPRAGGSFIVTESAEPGLRKLDEAEKKKLTTFIIDENRFGNNIPVINTKTIKHIRTRICLPLQERRNRLMIFLEKNTNMLGRKFDYDQRKDGYLSMMAWTESTHPQEMKYLVEMAKEEHMIFGELRNDGGYITIAPKGYAYLEELRGANPDSTQGFVAMWFHPDMNDAYQDGIAPAIRECGYEPLRIDQKEHCNKIDDEIIAEIRRSRFLVADFTSEPEKQRGGVYFEAGFARGLNIPVIWTCQKGLEKDVHFDTRQFNHIFWSDASDLHKRLKNRILAEIGEGPVRPDSKPPGAK